jgi:hypothetical protein
MSNNWDVYCLDCESEHGFDGMNGLESLMHQIIADAPVCAELSKIARRLNLVEVQAKAGWNDGRVRLDWFEKHAAHRLIPRDEYGRFSGECGERFTCGECGDEFWCHAPKGHAGAHRKRWDEKSEKTEIKGLRAKEGT